MKKFYFWKLHMQSLKFLFLIFGKSHKVLREFLYFAQRHSVVHSPLSELHSEPYGAVSSKKLLSWNIWSWTKFQFRNHDERLFQTEYQNANRNE